MKLLASLLTAAVVAAPAFSAASSDLAKGQDTERRVRRLPRRSGQSVLPENPGAGPAASRGTLVKQLSEYKSGKRNKPHHAGHGRHAL